jgi:hypothetical protein
MNMSVAPTPGVSSGAPSCFGNEWDSREPACTGGADPNFRDEEGRHVRPRCGWFATCGAVTQSSQRLIAPQTLIRPHTPAPAPTFTPTPQVSPPGMPPRPAWTPPVSHPPTTPQSVLPEWQRIEQQRQEGLRRAQAAPSFASSVRYDAPAPYQHSPQQPTQMQGPIHYPAQTWQVGYGMPAYLTQEEMRQPGESWWSVFVREIFRGALKALFHSGARYIDVNPFKGPPRS